MEWNILFHSLEDRWCYFYSVKSNFILFHFNLWIIFVYLPKFGGLSRMLSMRSVARSCSSMTFEISYNDNMKLNSATVGEVVETFSRSMKSIQSDKRWQRNQFSFRQLILQRLTYFAVIRPNDEDNWLMTLKANIYRIPYAYVQSCTVKIITVYRSRVRYTIHNNRHIPFGQTISCHVFWVPWLLVQVKHNFRAIREIYSNEF